MPSKLKGTMVGVAPPMAGAAPAPPPDLFGSAPPGPDPNQAVNPLGGTMVAPAGMGGPDPFAGAPYQARGESLVAQGKYDKAIEDFNASLNVDNKNANGWAGLGMAYEKQGNRAKAAESYQRALVIDPNNPVARGGASRIKV
jgi:tetratricopeptide (TPR) repeat protein